MKAVHGNYKNKREEEVTTAERTTVPKCGVFSFPI